MKNIWFKFERHDYMDEYPEVFYRTFPTIRGARRFAERMSENYSGGTTTFIGYALKQEVLNYVKDNKLSLSEEVLSEINDDEMYHNVRNDVFEDIVTLKWSLDYAFDRDDHACIADAIDEMQEAVFMCGQIKNKCQQILDAMLKAVNQN
jgi:hypothetical protein